MLNQDASIDIDCPNCNKKVSIKVRELQSGKLISCPQCHLKFDTTDVKKGLEDVEKKLQEFSKSISKQIDIKFKI